MAEVLQKENSVVISSKQWLPSLCVSKGKALPVSLDAKTELKKEFTDTGGRSSCRLQLQETKA